MRSAGLQKVQNAASAGCCARAANGNVAAAPPSNVIKSRGLMYPLGRTCFLLHCDGHTTHGGRHLSADPGTTEL